MKIKEITIKNFRLLKDFKIELENELSLVIGKNNVGKTSLLSVLDKFLNSNEQGKKFQYNDFNLDFREDIQSLIESDVIKEENYKEKGICLRLFIKYTEKDDLEYISPILMDLDENNYYLVLGFDYVLSYDKYYDMRKDFSEFKEKEHKKVQDAVIAGRKYESKSFNDFMELKQDKYFFIKRKSIAIDKNCIIDENNYIDLKDIPTFHVNDVVNFQYISAKRNVDNRDVDKTLSNQTSELYNLQETDDDQQTAIEEFQDSLKETDNVLSSVYDKMFHDIVDKVKQFGGMSKDETIIKVVSSLQHREILKGNTTVVYQHENKELPENYNGLGYMNLIYMIFDIDIIIKKMRRNRERKPADINLLFIEEPEAHTHPQMQYIFIKNIKNLLKQGILNKNGIRRELQYIITSHSSHIVSDCDFDDIKYLCHSNKNDGTIDKNSIISKNMRDLKEEYDGREKPYFEFLKQYLTLSRSELFFADKAIFIEGDTERILIPAMMKKIDQEYKIADHEENLLSQNISVVVTGAYSHIFDKFIRFIGLRKSLIITDIDYCKPTQKPDKNGVMRKSNKKHEYDSTDTTLVTSNNSIKHFTRESKIDTIMSNAPFIMLWNSLDKKWNKNDNGNLRLAFQYAKDEEYHPRSFEDAFFNVNKNFICNEEHVFNGLKKDCIDKFKNDENSYDLAQEGVIGKSTLALEILFNSKRTDNSDYSNWNIPEYIKEGLLWLRKN